MSNPPNPIDIEVGSRIKAQRRTRGMSQGTLAAALGISFQQVQKYEKGDNRVSASRLAAIATIFELPVSYFFEDQAGEAVGDLDHTAGELVRFIETKEGRDLNLAFAQICSPSLRKRIIGVVKAVAEPALSAGSPS